MINYPEINWKDQCKFCSRGLNTTYCRVNQDFIDYLILSQENCRGEIDFEYEFFSLDKKLVDECLTNNN